nr:hypothetical protein CFP56_42216 [Quercus suber]
MIIDRKLERSRADVLLACMPVVGECKADGFHGFASPSTLNPSILRRDLYSAWIKLSAVRRRINQMDEVKFNRKLKSAGLLHFCLTGAKPSKLWMNADQPSHVIQRLLCTHVRGLFAIRSTLHGAFLGLLFMDP